MDVTRYSQQGVFTLVSTELRQKKTDRWSFSRKVKAKTVKTINQIFVGSDRAVVDEAIHPDCPGRVRFQATWWPAHCERNVMLKPGDEVRVVGIRNITLLVEPMLEMA